jgi:hypothetical protein
MRLGSVSADILTYGEFGVGFLQFCSLRHIGAADKPLQTALTSVLAEKSCNQSRLNPHKPGPLAA